MEQVPSTFGKFKKLAKKLPEELKKSPGEEWLWQFLVAVVGVVGVLSFIYLIMKGYIFKTEPAPEPGLPCMCYKIVFETNVITEDLFIRTVISDMKDLTGVVLSPRDITILPGGWMVEPDKTTIKVKIACKPGDKCVEPFGNIDVSGLVGENCMNAFEVVVGDAHYRPSSCAYFEDRTLGDSCETPPGLLTQEAYDARAGGGEAVLEDIFEVTVTLGNGIRRHRPRDETHPDRLSRERLWEGYDQRCTGGARVFDEGTSSYVPAPGQAPCPFPEGTPKSEMIPERCPAGCTYQVRYANAGDYEVVEQLADLRNPPLTENQWNKYTAGSEYWAPANPAYHPQRLRDFITKFKVAMGSRLLTPNNPQFENDGRGESIDVITVDHGAGKVTFTVAGYTGTAEELKLLINTDDSDRDGDAWGVRLYYVEGGHDEFIGYATVADGDVTKRTDRYPRLQESSSENPGTLLNKTRGDSFNVVVKCAEDAVSTKDGGNYIEATCGDDDYHYKVDDACEFRCIDPARPGFSENYEVVGGSDRSFSGFNVDYKCRSGISSQSGDARPIEGATMAGIKCPHHGGEWSLGGELAGGRCWKDCDNPSADALIPYQISSASWDNIDRNPDRLEKSLTNLDLRCAPGYEGSPEVVRTSCGGEDYWGEGVEAGGDVRETGGTWELQGCVAICTAPDPWPASVRGWDGQENSVPQENFDVPYECSEGYSRGGATSVEGRIPAVACQEPGEAYTADQCKKDCEHPLRINAAENPYSMDWIHLDLNPDRLVSSAAELKCRDGYGQSELSDGVVSPIEITSCANNPDSDAYELSGCFKKCPIPSPDPSVDWDNLDIHSTLLDDTQGLVPDGVSKDGASSDFNVKYICSEGYSRRNEDGWDCSGPTPSASCYRPRRVNDKIDAESCPPNAAIAFTANKCELDCTEPHSDDLRPYLYKGEPMLNDRARQRSQPTARRVKDLNPGRLDTWKSDVTCAHGYSEIPGGIQIGPCNPATCTGTATDTTATPNCATAFAGAANTQAESCPDGCDYAAATPYTISGCAETCASPAPNVARLYGMAVMGSDGSLGKDDFNLDVVACSNLATSSTEDVLTGPQAHACTKYGQPYGLTGCYPKCRAGADCLDLIVRYTDILPEETDAEGQDFESQWKGMLLTKLGAEFHETDITYYNRVDTEHGTIIEYQISCRFGDCAINWDHLPHTGQWAKCTPEPDNADREQMTPGQYKGVYPEGATEGGEEVSGEHLYGAEYCAAADTAGKCTGASWHSGAGDILYPNHCIWSE